MPENFRSARGAQAFGQNHVLYSDGNAREPAGIFPRGDLCVHAFRGLERPLGRKQQIRVRLRILPFGNHERLTGEFNRAEFSLQQALANALNRMSGHRSITLGTLK